MSDALSADPYWERLIEGYTDSEIAEIEQYLLEWESGTYSSAAHSVIDHAGRKQFDRLKYLRKANSFSKKGAKRVPKLEYRSDGTAAYRKGREFLIVRLDQRGIERIVTYGINED
jgi:hypothetical protein